MCDNSRNLQIQLSTPTLFSLDFCGSMQILQNEGSSKSCLVCTGLLYMDSRIQTNNAMFQKVLLKQTYI